MPAAAWLQRSRLMPVGPTRSCSRFHPHHRRGNRYGHANGVAVPIAPPETCDALRQDADEVVRAVTPEPFYAVGLWYTDFTQTTDQEVHDILERGRHELASAPLPRR